MWFWMIVCGIIGGVLGGLGMGGGTLLIPLLTLGLHFDQVQAQAINLISFIPMAIFSLAVHVKNKLVDFKQLIFILPLAVVAGAFSAYYARSIDQIILKKFFGALMITIGVVFLIKTIIDKFMSLMSDHN